MPTCAQPCRAHEPAKGGGDEGLRRAGNPILHRPGLQHPPGTLTPKSRLGLYMELQTLLLLRS